jgi:hypothetical protein
MNCRGKIIPFPPLRHFEIFERHRMEGRGLTKGNLPQQNATRTPSRTVVPNALERVRQAARKDKKLRFTALLHHIYNLESNYKLVLEQHC